MRYPSWPLVTLIMLSLVLNTLAGEITLKNGDRLTGKIVDQTDEAIVIETEYAGKVKIARAHIEKVILADAEAAASGRRDMAKVLRDTGNTEPLLVNVYPKLLGATTFTQRPELADSVRASVRAAPSMAAAWAQLAMAARPDSLPTLAAINVPALVVVGAEDVLSLPSDAEEMANVLPDGELVVIADVGHLTPLEVPAEVSSALQGRMPRGDE